MARADESDLNLLYDEYQYLRRLNTNILTSPYWLAAQKLTRIPLLEKLLTGFAAPLDEDCARAIAQPAVDIENLRHEDNMGNTVRMLCDQERSALQSVLDSSQWRLYRAFKTLAFHLPPAINYEIIGLKLQKAYHSDWSTLPLRVLGPQLYKWFSKLSIKSNWVLFESHRGLAYACNPKYIYEELVRQEHGFKCVWSFESPRRVDFSGKYKVKRFGLRYFYYLARSKYLVHNAVFYPRIRYRDGQVYVNTQHGTPLKYMGKDITNAVQTPGEAEPGRNASTGFYWNVLVSPNAHSTEVFTRCFDYKGPVLESGYPRNDIFYAKNNARDIGDIKKRYGIPLDKRVLLYAPTWRDTRSKTVDSKFDLKLDLEVLRRELESEYVLILRLHHLISSVVKITQGAGNFVFDLSLPKYDIQEFLLVADVLITDYSSVMFDYANLDRPQIYYAYDYEHYSDIRRGTYFDLEDKAPGPVVRTQEELVKALKNLEEDTRKYAHRRKEFCREYCGLECGESSRKVVEEVFVRRAYDDRLRPRKPASLPAPVKLREEVLGVRAIYSPFYLHPMYALRSKSRFVKEYSRKFQSYLAELRSRNYERAVIFGNASCLNEIDKLRPGYFSDENYLTIGLNRSLLKVHSEVVMWTDLMTMDDILLRTQGREEPTTFLHVHPQRDHKMPALLDKRFISLAEYWRTNRNFREWKGPGLYIFRNILISALHLCYLLDIKEVLLTGIDMETRNYFHKQDAGGENEYEIRSEFQVERLCQGYSTQRITREVLEYLLEEEGFNFSYSGGSGFLASISGLRQQDLASLPGAMGFDRNNVEQVD